MKQKNKQKVKNHLEKSGYTVETLEYPCGNLLFVKNPSDHSSLFERVKESSPKNFTIELINKNKFRIDIE